MFAALPILAIILAAVAMALALAHALELPGKIYSHVLRAGLVLLSPCLLWQLLFENTTSLTSPIRPAVSGFSSGK